MTQKNLSPQKGTKRGERSARLASPVRGDSETSSASFKNAVLTKIANADELAWSLMLTPRDLEERFLFPEGNVDHTMMTEGQNFCHRHFSPNPDTSF